MIALLPDRSFLVRSMLELNDYKSLPDAQRGGVVAIGNFDGVHLGHQAVLGQALDLARREDVAAGVMFFNPHPRQFFSPDTPLFLLTNRAQKLSRFAALGLDFSVEIAFDAQLSAMSAAQFVETVLVKGLQVSHVVIGYDFFFGAKRSGNPEVMRTLGAAHGFGVRVVSPSGDGGLIYSSTAVRDALEAGQVKRAAAILGRNWQVMGRVISGAGRGEGLGFPTANINLPDGCHLQHGIYAALVHHETARYMAAAYYGKRPSFDNDAPVLEVFLFDFDRDLYGQDIVVEFVDFVRPDMKFDDPDALKKQMEDDCRTIELILSDH